MGIDYSRLQNLLAARKWEKAGVEETRVMLQAANREKEGWLRPGVDIENISCEDLRIMDSMTEWYEWDNDNDKVDNEKEKDWAQGAINGFNWQMIARVLGVEEKFNRRFELSGREGIELFRVFFGYLHEMSNEWKKREKDCGI